MTEEQKNYFNVLNLIGAAFIGTAAVSLAKLLTVTQPLLGTIAAALVAVTSFGVIRYDSTLNLKSNSGIAIGVIFILSSVMTAFSLINLLSVELGFTSLESVDNLSGIVGESLITMAVGLVIFGLGEVFEE